MCHFSAPKIKEPGKSSEIKQEISILNKGCDFEIANLHYRKIHNTVVNKYCMLKDQTQVYLFSLVINNCISFIEIKNLINPLNTKLSPKNTVFNRLVRFFSCHDAK